MVEKYLGIDLKNKRSQEFYKLIDDVDNILPIAYCLHEKSVIFIYDVSLPMVVFVIGSEILDNAVPRISIKRC
ncbi:hypothetical protein SF1_14550 [Sphingobacterium faecium NBRC 15299]|nr:hypothetical protein SF1_14550 [Sphingobacterium faecium NBRC 15299]